MSTNALALFFTEHAWYWFGSSLLLFVAACAATAGGFTRRRRNLLRAAVFAILMTPCAFGVHDVTIIFPASLLLLAPSAASLVALAGMAVTGTIVFALLSALPERPAPARELVLIGTGVLVLAASVIALAVIAHAIRLHSEYENATAEALAESHRQAERNMKLLESYPALAYTRDAGGVLVLARPREFSRDYAIIPPDDETRLRFRLDTTQFAESEFLSVRDPGELTWTTVAGDGIVTFDATGGNVLLVTLEKRQHAGKSVGIAVPTVLEPGSSPRDE